MIDQIRQLPDPATPVEIAQALRITPAAVRRAIKRGDLKALMTSRRGDARIPHVQIEAWLSGDAGAATAGERASTSRDEAVRPTDPWVLLDTADVCALVHASRSTLWRWILSGFFPAPDKVLPGGRKTWFRSTVQNWLAADRRERA